MPQKFMWRLAIVLMLAIPIWLAGSLPVFAQSLDEYFELTYEPVSFSKSEIHGSEVFQAVILGHAACIKDLPVSASEVSITSSVIAEQLSSGNSVTLNSSYTVTIKPFPSKAGDTTEINQAVALQFPAQAAAGDYSVIGKLVEAKVKIGFGWVDVSGFLPQDQLMGSLKYIAPESTSTTAPTPTPSTAPTPTLTTPSTPVPPTPTPSSMPTPAPTPPQRGITWWVWLIVAAAVTTTVINIIWFLRHRST